MNISYLIYQAERPVSRAEQRAIDIERGEFARAVSGLRRRNRPARQDLVVVPDHVPAEWTESVPR
jgi:hypothetical protein